MSEDLGPVTMAQAVALAEVLRAVDGTLRVRWVNEHGGVFEGTARSIGDERGNFARGDVDIRGEYLRVTGVTGFEYFMRVMDLLPKIGAGEFYVEGP